MATDDSEARQRVDALITDLRREIKAESSQSDRRYEQRFQDQERAVAAALAAQEKAVSAALLAADKAVAKAEVAAEKRFDAVNEFRAQLADQASTFIPRQEAEARLGNLDEKLATNIARIETVANRVENAEGKGAGHKEGWEFFIGAIGVLALIATIAVEIILRTHH